MAAVETSCSGDDGSTGGHDVTEDESIRSLVEWLVVSKLAHGGADARQCPDGWEEDAGPGKRGERAKVSPVTATMFEGVQFVGVIAE